MKNVALLMALVVFGLGMPWGCVTTQTGPDRGPARIEGPMIEDRFVALQRKIDHGKISGRYPGTEGKALQFRLDAIRGEYYQMTKDRYPTRSEMRDISNRLDLLEKDLNQFR
jgi:hypothetical protein